MPLKLIQATSQTDLDSQLKAFNEQAATRGAKVQQIAMSQVPVGIKHQTNDRTGITVETAELIKTTIVIYYI